MTPEHRADDSPGHLPVPLEYRRPGMSDAYWDHIAELAASAPPLSADQCDRIRRLFAPVVAQMQRDLGRAS